MGSFTTNTHIQSIDNILHKGIKSLGGDIKVVDYIVDAGMMDESKNFTAQDTGHVVVELSLSIDIDKLASSPIDGYDLVITNKESGKKSKISAISFFDDFDDVINTGQKDLRSIVQNIKKTQQLMMYQGEVADPTVGGVVYSDKAPAFIDLQSTNNFSTIAKDFLLNGVSINDTIELQMPLYAVASAQTGIAATHGNGDLTKINGLITYTVGGIQFTDRVSLAKKRSKYKAESIQSTERGAIAQLSTPDSQGIGKGPAAIVVGNYVKVSSNVFKSKRRIELPRKIWESDIGLDFKFIPTISEKSEKVIETNAKSVFYDMKTAVKNLFLPEIPPRVQITRNDYGEVSLVVHRGDPSTKLVEVKTSYWDVNKKKFFSYEDSSVIDFDVHSESTNLKNQYSIPIQKCMNYGPYITTITAQAISNFGAGISTELVVPSLPHKEYTGNYIEDNVVITAVNLSDSISIIVDNSDIAGAVSISLHRENLSVPPSSFQRHKLIGVASPSSTRAFSDYSVINGNSYRYYLTAEVRHHRGYNQSSTIYERRQFSGDYVITRNFKKDCLYIPSISRLGEAVYPPVFALTTDVSRGVYDALIEESKVLLDSMGLDAEDALSKIITDNTKELSKFVVYNVQRINLSTGESVNLGDFMDGQVCADPDSEYSITSRFRYIFRLSVISPFGLAFLSKEKYDKAAYFLEKDFIEATGVMGGTVTPESMDTSRYSTGIEIVKEVDPILPKVEVSGFSGEINSLGGYAEGKPSLRLTWLAGGGTNAHVHAFYVVCNYNGDPRVLATIPGSDVTNTYEYTDAEYFNEIGKKKYYVLTEMNDMTFAHKTDELIYTKSYDDTSLEGAGTSIIETASEKGLDIPLETFPV